MKKWVIRAKKADFAGIAQRHGVSEITARLLRNRDLITDEEIDYYLHAGINDMHDPFLLKDVSKACNLIINAINDGKSIRVVGDYDIDGVCATAILVRALRATGGKVSYRLPHRIRDGYGLNNTIIDEAAADDVDMIVTCDNGIAAKNEIAHAGELNIDVIVTDHHEIPFEEINGEKQYILPDALCIVNPHQVDDTYPFKDICGAMVAYKLVLALQTVISSSAESQKSTSEKITAVQDTLKEASDVKIASEKASVRLFSEQETSKKLSAVKEIPTALTDMLFDFAAFATVGDIMPLMDENRVAVKYGLRSMKNTSNIGLSALIDATGIKRDRLSTYHIGFVLGPCINAAGRLDTADTSLELFLTEDVDEAAELAKTIKETNDLRKEIMESKINDAIELVETGSDGHNYEDDTVLLIYMADCHESLAGLIASKVKDRFSKPTIVFTDAEQGIKGSGRSIEAYDIFANLSKYKELFIKFGGHPMACGLTIDKKDFEELRRRVNQDSPLTKEDLIEKYYIDIDMPINYVSRELLNELELLAPYGNSNEAPLFAQKNLIIVSRKKNLKGNQVTLQLKSGPHGQKPETVMFAQMFGDADEILGRLEGKSTLTLAYVPEYNDYFERVQLKIKDFI